MEVEFCRLTNTGIPAGCVSVGIMVERAEVLERSTVTECILILHSTAPAVISK